MCVLTTDRWHFRSNNIRSDCASQRTGYPELMRQVRRIWLTSYLLPGFGKTKSISLNWHR